MAQKLIYIERDYDFCIYIYVHYIFCNNALQNCVQELYKNDALCIRSKIINVSLNILALLLDHSNAYFF